jgi:hypothetical protein
MKGRGEDTPFSDKGTLRMRFTRSFEKSRRKRILSAEVAKITGFCPTTRVEV